MLFRWIVPQQWELWKLKRAKRRAERFYDSEERKAKREKKTAEEKQEILVEAVGDVFYCQDQIAAHVSRMLLDRAQDYGIPTPAYDDKSAWEESGFVVERRHLNTKASAELRSAIRREQNERWQFWELRLKVLGAVLVGLTGAMGTLIGLIATLRH